MTIDRRRLERALQGIGLTKDQAARALRKTLEEVHGALANGRSVAIRSFGVFSARGSRRREMWNPRKGALCRIDGGDVLRFKAAREFSRMVRIP